MMSTSENNKAGKDRVSVCGGAGIVGIFRKGSHLTEVTFEQGHYVQLVACTWVPS